MKSLERLFTLSIALSSLFLSNQHSIDAAPTSAKATPKTQPKVTPTSQPKAIPTAQVKPIQNDRFLFVSCSDTATKKVTLNLVISQTKSAQLSSLAGTRLVLLEPGNKTPNNLKFIAGAPFEEAGVGHRYFTLHGLGTLINSTTKASITKLVIDTASDGQTQSTRITISPANASKTDTGKTLENCQVNNRELLMKLLGK